MIIWRTLVASPHGGPVAAVNPRKTWKRPSLARQPVGWHAFRSHGDGHEEGEGPVPPTVPRRIRTPSASSGIRIQLGNSYCLWRRRHGLTEDPQMVRLKRNPDHK